MSASEVKDHILDMISILNQKIPTSQVVISGLLPRGDYLNDKVIECNRLLAREINTLKNTRFIDHTNISSSRREILFDNKHLTKYVGVPLLKQNILKAVSPFTTISNKPLPLVQGCRTHQRGCQTWIRFMFRKTQEIVSEHYYPLSCSSCRYILLLCSKLSMILIPAKISYISKQ